MFCVFDLLCSCLKASFIEHLFPFSFRTQVHWYFHNFFPSLGEMIVTVKVGSTVKETASFEHLDEVLQKQERRLAGANRKILLHFLAFLATEGRIDQHHVEAVLFLDVGQILGQRIGMHDVRRFDAMQDHVHDPDDVGK